MSNKNHYLPKNGKIINIVEESPDVKTFTVEIEGGEHFGHKPGQFAELSVMGVGECPISISSPAHRGPNLEFSIKKIGRVTDFIHRMEVGENFGIRGPFGNSFPMDYFKGKDVSFICGGIGLAPLRSILNTILDDRDNYGKVTFLYGSSDMPLYKKELEQLSKVRNLNAYINWDRKNGFVRSLIREVIKPSRNGVAITCGPAVMVKATLATLHEMGFKPEQLITTLEMKMKCGVGKCGRCNIGHRYICVDGPVFTYEQLLKMPNEF